MEIVAQKGSAGAFAQKVAWYECRPILAILSSFAHKEKITGCSNLSLAGPWTVVRRLRCRLDILIKMEEVGRVIFIL